MTLPYHLLKLQEKLLSSEQNVKLYIFVYTIIFSNLGNGFIVYLMYTLCMPFFGIDHRDNWPENCEVGGLRVKARLWNSKAHLEKA